MSIDDVSDPERTGRADRMQWILAALAGLAIIIGIWAWGLNGSAPPVGASGRSILLTEATVPMSKGADVRVESGVLQTRDRTWAAYWSYFCLIPGEVTRWHTRLWLVRVAGKRAISRRLIYQADNSSGPVSYTQFFHERGPGEFRFIVDTTPHCVWSLRAPPVASRGMAS